MLSCSQDWQAGDPRRLPSLEFATHECWFLRVCLDRVSFMSRLFDYSREYAS